MAEHICHRCMQPLPEDAARCPHCGSPQVRLHRKRILIALASAMVLAGLLLVFFMVRHPSGPPDGDADEPGTITTPDKPPPLNQ